MSTLVEAVAIVKDRMGARAQNALKEVRAGRELFGSVLREHIPGEILCALLLEGIEIARCNAAPDIALSGGFSVPSGVVG